MNWLRNAQADPHIQRRAFRLRRRNDEARRIARLRRYWRAIGHAEIADLDRVPDPRECSCFLCRGWAIDQAKRREAISPKADEEVV